MFNVRRAFETRPDEASPLLEVVGLAKVNRMVFQPLPIDKEPIAVRYLGRSV